MVEELKNMIQRISKTTGRNDWVYRSPTVACLDSTLVDGSILTITISYNSDCTFRARAASKYVYSEETLSEVVSWNHEDLVYNTSNEVSTIKMVTIASKIRSMSEAEILSELIDNYSITKISPEILSNPFAFANVDNNTYGTARGRLIRRLARITMENPQ